MFNKKNEDKQRVMSDSSINLTLYKTGISVINSDIEGNIDNDTDNKENNFGNELDKDIEISNFEQQSRISCSIDKLDKSKPNVDISVDKHNKEIINEHFEYGNNYGYLYTRLKYILDNNAVSGNLKKDLYSLLETLGELRILGVYNEPYKRYRRALDNYTIDLNKSGGVDKDTIGELRYLCYQSSASGRKELKLIDKSIKELNKKYKESKLLDSCRDAMSYWLNKNELYLNKVDSQTSNSEQIFMDMLESNKDANIPLQQSLFLSFLSLSYISEKIYPYMLSHMNSNTGTPVRTQACINDLNKVETSIVSNSLSSIEGFCENHQLKITEKDNLEQLDAKVDSATKNNDIVTNNSKITNNESVMNWIKNNRKQVENNDVHGALITVDENDDSQNRELNELILNNKNNIISNRVSNKNFDLDLFSNYEKLSNEDLLKEFFDIYKDIYDKFFSIRENLHKKRKYYKSIPTIGSSRFKKQFLENEEVRLRQFQSVYNNNNLPEIPEKIRRVLIYRSEWKRPPMHLLITHMSRECSGTNPLAKEEHIDYDIDTDEDWEEQFGGEDVDNIDDGMENCDEDDDNEAVSSGWLVPDGCFQFDELLEDNVLEIADKNGNNNMVNLLYPLSSKYPAPVVISFLNHTTIDFGVGISIPNEANVKCLLKEYLIFFPQEIDWVYEKSRNLERYSRDKLDPEDDINNIKNSELILNRKSVLDFSLKQELAYFVHGRWISIKKIISEFMNLNKNKDLKRAAIVHFLKENVYRTKLEGDTKFRWYVKENIPELNLDQEKLNKLLEQRKLEEKLNLTFNKQNSSKNEQNKLNNSKDLGFNFESFTPIQFSQNSQTTNSSKKDKPLQLLDCSLEYKEIEDSVFSTPNILMNLENVDLNSQGSIKSNEYVDLKNESSKIQANNIRKRKHPTPNRETPNKIANINYVNSEKTKVNVQSVERSKLINRESKGSNTPTIHDNSLITHFFTTKHKN